MFSFFKAKEAEVPPLKTDIHSHLLPQLDDGVKSLEESAQLVRQFMSLGYTKLVTTPHVMNDFYRNDPGTIAGGLESLKQFLAKENINVSIEAAAEYYLDESLMERVNKNERLLTFGANYLLFETNFLTEPFQLKEFIFSATTQGYKPVMAHPERYQYLVNDFGKAGDLKDRGVLFQVNIPSIIGAYSRPIQKLAIQLIRKGWVDFIGSDCHNQTQMAILKEAFKNKYFKKALALPLLNRTL